MQTLLGIFFTPPPFSKLMDVPQEELAGGPR